MALKVNEVVIQAKISGEPSADAGSDQQSDGPVIPKSVKQEIIDLCMEKVKAYIDRHIRDARR